MGSCFYGTAKDSIVDQLTAKVFTMDSSLIEYSTPVSVEEVLGSYSVSCFLCNSDSLNYNAHISALPPDEMVQFGQLYFVLPIEKIKSTLLGSDMALLAIKVSSAVEAAEKSRWSRDLVQVVPMFETDGLEDYKKINEL